MIKINDYDSPAVLNATIQSPPLYALDHDSLKKMYGTTQKCGY